MTRTGATSPSSTSSSSSSSDSSSADSTARPPSAVADPEVAASDPTTADRPRGRSRPTRPTLPSRKSSGTIVVPRNHPDLASPVGRPPGSATTGGEEAGEGAGSVAMRAYGPDDARGMSPRRSSHETAALEAQTRRALRAHAQRARRELLEIAESIELVRADHDKLERQNSVLQDYIGKLTRTMSVKEGRKGRKGK